MNNNFKVKNLEDLSKIGIYKITCLSNSKVYIGSSSYNSGPLSKNGFYGRWKGHISKLKLNKHRNKHLQYAWNKYGYENFIFEILEFCDKSTIEEKEIYWIDFYDCCNQEKGFNFLRQSLRNVGPQSEETRIKISKSMIGKRRPRSDFKSKMKPVLQFTKDRNFINEFECVSDAFRYTKVQRQDIGKVCNGKLKSAGGFIWKFKLDNDIV